MVSDEILMIRFSRGDDAAFHELVSRYRNRLLNFIYRRAGSRELAEDIVQETFLRVVNAAPRYQVTAKFNTWLYTIALNLWRNELARKRPAHAIDAGVVDERPDIEIQADFNRLREMMQDLSEEHSLVLELSFVEGWTNQQIAEILNCSLGTVKSRKFYALKTLRKRMGIHEDEGMRESARAN